MSLYFLAHKDVPHGTEHSHPGILNTSYNVYWTIMGSKGVHAEQTILDQGMFSPLLLSETLIEIKFAFCLLCQQYREKDCSLHKAEIHQGGYSYAVAYDENRAWHKPQFAV